MQILPRRSDPLAERIAAWRKRVSLRALLLLVLAVTSTRLAIDPGWLDSTLALWLGLALFFLVPGYLIGRIIAPDDDEWTVARLPHWFAYSLAVWAVPATALQLLGASWVGFRVVFVLLGWVLGVVALSRPRGGGGRRPAFRLRALAPELVLLGLGIGAALLTMSAPRDGDDWSYLIIVQSLASRADFQLVSGVEARYTLRYVFHVWFFGQAFLREWLNADLVTLAREVLPALLAPLALWSFYGWARTFLGGRRAALLALLVQCAIAITFTYGEGWGRGLFVRVAQDKFVVWLVLFPVILQHLWQWLSLGRRRDLFALALALLAGVWVHVVVLFILLVGVAGVALFNLTSRVAFPRRRWALVALVALPVLATPLVVRATTLPAVFTVDTNAVDSYMRLARDRLLFQPPFYLIHPDLIAHPLLLFALALLVGLASSLRGDRRVQFLWGSALVPLALAVNPYTARLLGEMLTPWQLWRFTWNLPAALILTLGLVRVASYIRQGMRGGGVRGAFSVLRTPRAAMTAAVVVALMAGSVAASDVDFGRSFAVLTRGHALDGSVAEMMQLLQRTLDRPARVVVPRELTRLPPAYTARALVLTTSVELPRGAAPTELDQFYDPASDAGSLEQFLTAWEIGYVMVENGSTQDRYLRSSAEWQLLRRNQEFAMYARR